MCWHSSGIRKRRTYTACAEPTGLSKSRCQRLISIMATMLQATEKTSLLANTAYQPCHSLIPPLCYLITFCSCLICTFVSLIPPPILDAALPRGLSLVLQTGIPTDYALEMLWPILQRVLDDAVFLSLVAEQDEGLRRRIRKSESLSTVLKGSMKIMETITTLFMVVARSSLPLFLGCSLVDVSNHWNGPTFQWLYLCNYFGSI